MTRTWSSIKEKPFLFSVLPEEISSHVELIAVEENPGDITETKHEDNADKNEGKVDFTPNWAICTQMGEPYIKKKNKQSS